MKRIALLLLVVLLGCGDPQPQKIVIEVNGDDATKAAVATGIADAREKAQYAKQANDEMERLLAELDAGDKRGLTPAETDGKAALGKLWGEYNRQPESFSGAKAFVDKVKGKRLDQIVP